jgi:hypothetical protein
MFLDIMPFLKSLRTIRQLSFFPASFACTFLCIHIFVYVILAMFLKCLLTIFFAFVFLFLSKIEALIPDVYMFPPPSFVCMTLHELVLLCFCISWPLFFLFQHLWPIILLPDFVLFLHIYFWLFYFLVLSLEHAHQFCFSGITSITASKAHFGWGSSFETPLFMKATVDAFCFA